MSTHCEACHGHGWLLQNNNAHGLQVERCDACGRFPTDEQAVIAVCARAKGMPPLVNACQTLLRRLENGDTIDQHWYEVETVRAALAKATKGSDGCASTTRIR